MSERWSFDPSTVSLSQEAELTCAFSFALEPEHWSNLFLFGTWWVLPLGHRRGEVMGIRLIPGRPLSDCPIVKLTEHQALTIVSKPAYLVPYLLFPGMVTTRDGWDRVLAQPDSVWDELRAVHAALGGTDELRELRGVLGDARLRDACLMESPSADFRKAYPEIRKRCDPSADTVRYFEYLMNAVENNDAPMPLPQVGDWRAAAASVALSAANMDQQKDRALQAAWEIARQPSALDAFQDGSPSMVVEPMGRSNQLVSAAQMLVARESDVNKSWRTDPWWRASAALAEQAEHYDGAAHMNASGQLAELGRTEEAFVALTSSAYWMYIRTNEPFPSLQEAAIVLARDAGWTATEAALTTITESTVRVTE